MTYGGLVREAEVEEASVIRQLYGQRRHSEITWFRAEKDKADLQHFIAWAARNKVTFALILTLGLYMNFL